MYVRLMFFFFLFSFVWAALQNIISQLHDRRPGVSTIFPLFQTDSIIGKHLSASVCRCAENKNLLLAAMCTAHHRWCRFTVSRQNLKRHENEREKRNIWEEKVKLLPVWFPVCNQMTSIRCKLNWFLFRRQYFVIFLRRRQMSYAIYIASMKLSNEINTFQMYDSINRFYQIEWIAWVEDRQIE